MPPPRSSDTTPYVLQGPGARLLHHLPPGSGIEWVYDAGLRQHETLRTGIRPAVEFLRDPRARGLTPIQAWNPTDGRLVYQTTAVVSLAEVLAHRRGQEKPCGLASAITVLTRVTETLAGARSRAREHGLQAHGSLSPWRILLHPTGEIEVAGFGVPDVELFSYLDGQQGGVSLDTLRYAPPERLEDLEEDPRSDLYTLALIGAEMALGRPVFDGAPTEVAERVLGGDAPELIEAIGSGLDDEVLDLLCVATELNPVERFASFEEFLQQARAIRASGPSLAELVQEVLDARPTRGRPTQPDKEPEAATEDDGETQPGLEADFELVAAIPELPRTPTLAQVKEHARAIADRAQQLAEQADAMALISNQRGHGQPTVASLLRRIQDAVAKAHKAAKSTHNAAKLVDLDDDVDDAQMTLEMVRSAERLCVVAAESALDLLGTLQSEIDDLRAEQQQLDRAKRMADDYVERIKAAATEAKEASQELDAALKAGRYSVDGADDLIRAARDNAVEAREAAARAPAMRKSVLDQDRADLALRAVDLLKKAAEDTEEGRDAVRRVAKQLARGELEAVEALRTRAGAAVSRAESARRTAEQSSDRAVTAIADAPIASKKERLSAVSDQVRAAREAAEFAAELLRSLPDEGTAQAFQELASTLEAQARIAEQAARLAVEQSDQLVELAGEAAARAARVSKLQAEIEALEEHLQRCRSEVGSAWSKLEEDTVEVAGRTARDAIQVAERAVHKVMELAEQALAQPAIDAEPAALEARASLLRTTRDTLDELEGKALARCREARGAASRELEEIAERHRQQAELQRAIDRAKGHADRCSAAVQAAWEKYHETVELLASAAIEANSALRSRAYEVIDIAEYQAGEAASAAEMAADQTDPAEARSHASTAASFEERITMDLPEAMTLLDELGADARALLTRLTSARERLTAARKLAKTAVRNIEDHLAKAREAARDWRDTDVVRLALERLEHATDGIEAPLEEVRLAAARIDDTDDPGVLEGLIPVAEAAARHLHGTNEEVGRRATALRQAVQDTREEVEAQESALNTTRRAQEAVAAMQLELTERAQRLFAAIETHQANGTAVNAARTRMTQVLEVTQTAVRAIRAASPAILETHAAAEARALEKGVMEHLSHVEQQVEIAVEAETDGVKAAEREAAERAENEERQLKNARSMTLVHVGAAKQAAERGVAVLREASTELAGIENAEVRRLHLAARNLVSDARTAASGTLQAARNCQRAQSAAEAMDAEARAAALAGDAAQAVVDAALQIRQAVDIARRAEEEAQALQRVKAEVATIAANAVAGEQSARDGVAEVLRITEASSDPLTLACNEAAADLLSTAERAAEKIRTAAPMAKDAESLEVAQRLLDACRKTQQRLEDTHDELRELASRAQQLRSQEAERTAQRLNEARAEAEAPAAEARAIAEKARGWIATGQRVVDDSRGAPAATEAHAVLVEAVEGVARLASQAEQAAQPARRAATIQLARGLGERVRAAADRTLAAADAAREALNDLKAVGELALAERQSTEALLEQCAAVVNEAASAATVATQLAEELEQSITEANISDDEVATNFREVTRGAKSITQAAAVAQHLLSEAANKGYTEVAEDAQSMHAQRDVAVATLADLRLQEAACRDLLETKKRKTAEESKRQQDEVLRNRLRSKRNASTAMKREELKKRFQERDEEEEPRKPNLSVLRERLRARRKGEPDPREVAAAVERRPPPEDRPRRRRAEPDSSSLLLPEQESESDVQLEPDMLESPGRSNEAREESRRRREERRIRRQHTPERTLNDPPTRTEVGLITPAEPEPEPEDPDGADGADALLKRLRERQRRKN